MPKLTRRAARALEASFRGRITTAHEARAEFGDGSTVLIPESSEDVARALRIARAADRRVFVRSGRSVSASDVAEPAGAPPTGEQAAAIVSLEAFRDVATGDRRLTVGAAATTGEIARTLRGTDLFLPLDDNATQSVASAVLSSRTSPFLRSGTGTGSLRDAVVEAEAVPTGGAGARRVATFRDAALREVLLGDKPAVITRLVFDADAARTDAPDRWTKVWTAAYERKSFAALCTALFGAGARRVPERDDLSVRVTSAAYGMKLVVIRATGHRDRSAMEAVIYAAVAKAKLPVLESKAADGPGSSVAMWVATGTSELAAGDIPARFGSNGVPRPFASFRSAFLAAVDLAIGVDPRSGEERAPRVRAWAELQLAPGGDVIARAEVFDAEAEARVARRARQRMAAAIPADAPSPLAPVVPAAVVRRAPARAALRGVRVLPDLLPTEGFDLLASNRAGAATIPGFAGDVLQASDGDDYARIIQQYAVSSYPPEVVAARMTPRYVAVPAHASDVVLAVEFAARQGLAVVTRSGGHQYCGLSTGGNGTLLIDMRRFCGEPKFWPDTGAPTQVTVGPGVALRDLSSALRRRKVVIPHGECPLVNVGGHVQTGGIGHQLRSLGITLDWVRSFKMVTRDPQAPGAARVYRERSFSRPGAGGGSGAPTDADVFRAVLGGGPASWGVLTEVTFDLLSDGNSPRSAGFSFPYPYVLGETRNGFRVAMELLREWADRESRGVLPQGVDLFLSVVSGDFPRPPVLLVETMCMDQSGLAEIKAVVDRIDDAVPIPVRLAARLGASIKGRAPLSTIADEGVRRIGPTGLPRSGREFDLPYKKSLHITKAPFSPLFVDAFVDLVDRAHRSPGLKVVVQAVVGGGAFRSNGQAGATHMQRRDALVQLVFDVFHEERYEHEADSFQQAMKQLLGEYSGGADVRMLWGSFEDAGTDGTQLDMGRQATRELYYDSATEYARLRRVKQWLDPDDLFRTSFTVR